MYKDKLSFGKLDSTLTIKVSNWYASMSRQNLFALQDPYHVAKKLRNQLSLTETRVLILGKPDLNRERQLVARWDHLMQIATDNPDFLLICSRSAVDLTDKQDPSLVGELACLYKYFLDEKMYALGLYLKSIQLFLEAFYDETLLPEQKMQRAWYTKTFFVLWAQNATDPDQCISDESFKDLQCAIDGLFQYLLLLQRDFRTSPIVTKHLGSEVNENGFGFVRTGRFAGRRTNIDPLNLAYGHEKMNRHTELNSCHTDDSSVVAHARGGHVLRPIFGINEIKGAPKKLTGGDIHVPKLIAAMEQGTQDCVHDCKFYNLDFIQVMDVNRNINLNVDDVTLSDNEDSMDLDVSNDDDSGEMVNTPYGCVSRQRAECYYLNEGRSNIGAKGRQSRFYYNLYDQSRLASFNKICSKQSKDKKPCDLAQLVKKGDRITLPLFHRKNAKRFKKITGSVQFMSKDTRPIKALCKRHPLEGANVWLFCDGRYHRCVFNKKDDGGN